MKFSVGSRSSCCATPFCGRPLDEGEYGGGSRCWLSSGGGRGGSIVGVLAGEELVVVVEADEDVGLRRKKRFISSIVDLQLIIWRCRKGLGGRGR